MTCCLLPRAAAAKWLKCIFIRLLVWRAIAYYLMRPMRLSKQHGDTALSEELPLMGPCSCIEIYRPICACFISGQPLSITCCGHSAGMSNMGIVVCLRLCLFRGLRCSKVDWAYWQCGLMVLSFFMISCGRFAELSSAGLQAKVWNASLRPDNMSLCWLNLFGWAISSWSL